MKEKCPLCQSYVDPKDGYFDGHAYWCKSLSTHWRTGRRTMQSLRANEVKTSTVADIKDCGSIGGFK